MSYSDLSHFYQTLSSFIIASKFSISDIENMYPFERALFITLLHKYEEEQSKNLEN